ncbi:gliding motility-associated C-terminal domain-containing protein [Gaoshiqia sediminis]|uniref:Gliding motility-associated C-terminal domain-containing protein n=1 Tax=Gaoshiqia sediminis TaxID=2986998 RepID=A0AA41Y9P8_9BACT|nr:gliding motility-associated C-terminal domain-containing protein [Gaoshiqia sediminis]MCW0483862.1 gliding motility-associated C-terminal domain-containing protein [Gaoshiqia sediminis]
MNTNNWLFVFLLVNFLTIESYAGSVWEERFVVPDKGVWGDADGVTVHSDLDGIDQWTLNTDQCQFTAANDYVKTVTTSGGRFEVLDCDGEAVWMSRWIKIKTLLNVSCELTAWETGSGNNAANKFLSVYYQLDNRPEQLFETNGLNAGNWGEATVSQTGLAGDSLRIVVRMNSSYASDKVIFDNVLVQAEEPPLDPETLALHGEVLISEVLFNPKPYGSDFVELYNSSTKTIRLDHLYMAGRDPEGNLISVSPVSSSESYLQPGAYLLLSEDTANIRAAYPASCTENFWLVDQLPALPDSEGTLLLLDDSLEIIDEMYYFTSMHHPFLADEEGVSLECTSFDRDGTEADNWASCAASAGFATPGCPNSITHSELPSQEELTVHTDVFSPNYDGYNDFLSIGYSFSRADYVANVTVFDSRGRFVRKLIHQETAGQSGEWTWTGKQDDNTVARPGIYVIYIELTSPQGLVKRFRRSCTLTDRLL